MEDPKAEMTAEEARFLELFKGSSLEESAVKKAVEVFRECTPAGNLSAFGSVSGEEIERYWMASALYCVVKLGDIKDSVVCGKRGFNLSDIFSVTKLNAVDFFREIPQFLLKAGRVLNRLYGSDWEKRLEVKEVQMNLVHLRILKSYYRRAYEEFFSQSDVSNRKHSLHSSSSIESAYASKYHQFGWLLFLALRIHAFGRFRDLVTCTNGLISILAILILHVPIQFRKFHVLDCARLVKRSDKGLELLASLCDIYHTSEDDLKAAMDKTNNLIADILKKKPCPAIECRADSLAGINTAGLLYFEGLLEDSSLQSSIPLLEKDYVDAVCARGELDERMLVNDDDGLIGSGSLSASEVNVCSSKYMVDATSPPSKMVRKSSPPYSPASPPNGSIKESVSVAPTPVSTAMTTAKWLRTIVSTLSSKPTVELEHFFSSCDGDVTADVVRRANIILEAIFPCGPSGDQSIPGTLHSACLMDQTWIDQRKMESLKLYYRVLGAICRAESQMYGNNLTPLLSNERFHRCMLSCSAELVLASHKAVTQMFPSLLERTGITAFDLCKVIESFVRYEDTLPRELKRHLNSLEERLLENMAWERGSSMYDSLIVARPALSTVINQMRLQAEPMPSLDAISTPQMASYWSLQKSGLHRCETSPDRNGDIRSPKRLCTGLRNVLVERSVFTSPVKERLMGLTNHRPRLPPLQSDFATPTRQNPSRSGETCAETSISIFYSKIIKLAASRIKNLCEKLQLSNQIMEHVFCLFQRILNQNTSMFFNRHIDQLILCSFYGVAKISHLTLTFKEIINGYKKQPHCKPQVFRSVFVDWSQTNNSRKSGEDHVDIITFYNVVFIPSVKSLLMEISSTGSMLKSNQCPEDNNNVTGACPGSPLLSPFPTLPDMSPKKVSATHNVYVSPLRPSKMDALLSPSSRSFYACVGESTRAYESPSKDLNAINNRLNRGRKMRINFDLVSDSVVASTLGSQNDNCDRTSAPTAAPDKAHKHEQIDS